MELRLSRQLAEKRIFPAVDVAASSTRREELLIDPAQLKIMWRLRRLFAGLEQQQAIELVLSKLKDTQSNAEFLMVLSKTTPAAPPWPTARTSNATGRCPVSRGPAVATARETVAKSAAGLRFTLAPAWDPGPSDA